MPSEQQHIFGVKRPVPTRVDLTRQEIETLREIVTYASVIPETTPWNALFHAYDAVLKAKRLDAALDDKCFRFLMRMAEVQGKSWYDRFANLLTLWHYEVPPKTEMSSINPPLAFYASKIPNLDQITITFKGTRKPAGQSHDRPMPNPRIQNVDDEEQAVQKKPRPRETLRMDDHPAITIHRKALPPSDGEIRKREELERMKAEFAFPSTMIEDTTGLEETPASEMEPMRTNTSFLYEEDFEDQNEPNALEEEGTVIIPPIRDKAGLIAAAEKAVMRYNSLQLILRKEIFDHWRKRSRKAFAYHQLQWELACSKDQRVLTSQVMTIWRDATYWRATEKTAIWERRRMILLRCIDIWRQKTEFKVKRKALVNRNMLLRKFFKVWKAQAVSTAKKIKRFQQAIFLRKWRQNLAQIKALKEVAEQRYVRDLKYRAYWTLFYGYCNIRAPQIKDHRIKTHTFGLLKKQLDAIKERNAIADAFHCFHTLNRFFRVWHDDLQWTREMEAKADDERRQMVLYNTLLSWRRSARFAPMVKEQLAIHNANQVHDVISVWRSRLRQVRAADHVRKINVLKGVLRQWRLELRLKQHNLYVKAVYMNTWFDRYSCRLADKCYQYHVWKRWLGNWHGNLQIIRTAEANADDFADANANHHLKLDAVRVLRERLAKARTLNEMADDFRRRKLLRTTLNTMLEKHNQVRQMDSWATSAGYFFSAKKTMRLWVSAYEKRKRENRSAAYHQVKRNTKHRIKTQALRALYAKHEHIQTLSITAQDYYESGQTVYLANMVANWKERLHNLHVQNILATEFRNHQLVVSALNKWTRRLRNLNELHSLSDTYSDLSKKDALSGILKKWSNQVFRRRLDVVKADMFRERIESNHRKHVIRHWLLVTRERLQQRQVYDQLNREMSMMQHREEEELDDQFAREQNMHTRRRIFSPSEAGDRSVLGPEGISMLDVSEWIKSNPAATPFSQSVSALRIPQTPVARAARARALLQSRNSVLPSRMKMNSLAATNTSTTPVSTPPALRRFSRSIIGGPLRKSISSYRPDLRFTQSLSSKLREEIREEDESAAFLAKLDWGDDEVLISHLPNVDENEEYLKASGSTTIAATLTTP